MSGTAIQEAIGRLAEWDFSTPTGLAEGFDPGGDPFAPTAPSEAEIANSVAATIYATFRDRAIRNTIDATLSAIGLAERLPGARAASVNGFMFSSDAATAVNVTTFVTP